MRQGISKWIFYCVIISWFVIFIFTLHCCTDSKLLYILFSFVFLSLLLSSFSEIISYGYLFLSVFLCLGFWAKYSLHTVFKYSYVESIGHFSLLDDSFDPVFIISITGCLGVLIARYILRLPQLRAMMCAGKQLNTFLQNSNESDKKNYMLLILVIIITLAIFNIKYQTYQIGLVPQMVLAWPLNALIMWLFNIGLIMLVALITGFKGTKRLMLMLLLILIEATLSSISILSRSLFILHVAPVILVLLCNKPILKQLTKSSIILLVSLTLILFVISLKVVSTERNYNYSIKNSQNSLLQTVLGLAVDRWLGIEGVMAVSAYPDKNMALLKQGLFEKPLIGQHNMYQEIAQSQYRDIDKKRFSFGTLPGAIAFWDYSNSLPIVFLGMIFLTLLMILSEHLILVMSQNIFVSAVFGVNFAYIIEQFNTPIGVLKHCLFTLIVFIGIYIINCLRFITLKNREIIV